MPNMLLLFVLTLTASLTVGDCFSIQKPISQDDFERNVAAFENDSTEEPIFQPRFLPLFGDNHSNNFTIEKIAEVLQSVGNKTIQENIANAANAAADLALKKFGGDETVRKLIEVIRNPGNKTITENILNFAADLAVEKSGGDEMLVKVIHLFRNPDNNTLQENLIDIAADLALKKSNGDETIKKVVNIFKNPDEKSMQENVLSLAVDLGLKAFDKDDTIRKVMDVFQNPGNLTLQENLVNLASHVAFKKFGVDPSLRRVFEVIKDPGNRTFEDNLMDIAVDVALSKAGVDETLKKVAKTLLIPGNKTLQDNILSLASDIAAQKGSKIFGNVLGNFLGNDTAAVQEKVGTIGKALKASGGLLGGFLSKIGGNGVLGKIGQAITGGSHAVGGMMSNLAGNETKIKSAVGMIENVINGGNTTTIQVALDQAGSALISEAKLYSNANSDVATQTVEDNDEAVIENNVPSHHVPQEVDEIVDSLESTKKESESEAESLEENIPTNEVTFNEGSIPLLSTDSDLVSKVPELGNTISEGELTLPGENKEAEEVVSTVDEPSAINTLQTDSHLVSKVPLQNNIISEGELTLPGENKKAEEDMSTVDEPSAINTLETATEVVQKHIKSDDNQNAVETDHAIPQPHTPEILDTADKVEEEIAQESQSSLGSPNNYGDSSVEKNANANGDQNTLPSRVETSLQISHDVPSPENPVSYSSDNFNGHTENVVENNATGGGNQENTVQNEQLGENMMNIEITTVKIQMS